MTIPGSTPPSIAPTKPLADMTADELDAEFNRVIATLHSFDDLPLDVPLPDEWFVGRASLEARALDVETERLRRKRTGSQPPHAIPW